LVLPSNSGRHLRAASTAYGSALPSRGQRVELFSGARCKVQ
jgi:hypothetical protein